MDNILALLNTGLQKSGSLRTAVTLGDRSTYIGMSDIGKGVDCLRAAVAGKLPTQSAAGSGQLAEHQEQNLQRELRLQRGHWFEAGVLEAFKATGQPFIHQLTITSMNDVPVIAHPDFVFADETGDIQIVELKSCENIPESAYAAHEVQLFGQMGLLSSLQHEPCFSTDEYSESLRKLVRRKLNVILPEQKLTVTGAILYLSMNEAKVFGPYAPNRIMEDICLDLAKTIWSGMKEVRKGSLSLNDIPTVNGWHPLCDYCEWNADCPHFAGLTAPDFEEDLLDLKDLKLKREILGKRIQTAEERLKKTFHGVSPNGDWVNAVTQRFRVASCEGRKTLDKDRLMSALTAHQQGDNAENILNAGFKTGQAYERLMVNTIN